MGRPMKNYVAAAGGDLSAGCVLQKIAYWCGVNAKNGRQPETAMSYPQMAEQLGCSEQQARRAADRLVSLGVITREARKFGNGRVNWWRLTTLGRTAIDDGVLPSEEVETIGQIRQTIRRIRPTIGQIRPTIRRTRPTMYNEETLYQNTQETRPSDLAGPSGEGGSVTQTVSGGVSPGKGKDAVALMSEIKPRPLDKSKKGLTDMSAEAFWKDAWAKNRTSFCLPLQVKDRKALKLLAETCKLVGMDFDVFLDRCHKEWPAITAHAKNFAGAYSIPSDPTIHWTVQWRQPIFDFLLKTQAAEPWAPSKAAPAPSQSVVDVQSSAEPEPAPEPAPEPISEAPAEEPVVGQPDDDVPLTKEQLAKLMMEDD